MPAIVLLLLILAAASGQEPGIRDGDSVSWNPSYFSNCGILGDGNQKAELCYQRYELDLKDADESYCCPNWKLADCLINSVAPACPQERQENLRRFWKDFFVFSNDCPTFRNYLDASIPARCAWYYHKTMILGWTFGSLAVILLIVGLVTVIVVRKKQRNDSITNDSITNNQSG